MADATPVPSLICQRCSTTMELRDPAPGAAWAPVQYWVCARCDRHFWTTYPPPATPKAAEPKAEPAVAAAPAEPVVPATV